jgi:diacylglycerol kinase family enzyme
MQAGPALSELADAPVERRLRLQKVELVVNPLAGSVGPGAAAQAQRMLREFGLEPHLREPGPEELWRELRSAVDAAPDLLVVLAGDGTARSAACLCGPDGPMLAPLAGGTMNLLPHALYGQRPWPEALRQTLEHGAPRTVSGGEVDGERFFVAAILGPPALWAEAREAARAGRLVAAWRKARNAWNRAFRNQLGFMLDSPHPSHAQALGLICPLVSRALDDDEPMLEAAALDPKGPAAAVRLGLHALLSEMIGDWRKDPAVQVMRARAGVAWSEGGHVHAILDGEPTRLHRHVGIRFLPNAFRAYAPSFAKAPEGRPPRKKAQGPVLRSSARSAGG